MDTNGDRMNDREPRERGKYDSMGKGNKNTCAEDNKIMNDSSQDLYSSDEYVRHRNPYSADTQTNKKKKSKSAYRVLIAVILVIVVLFNAVYAVYRSYMGSINFIDGSSGVEITLTDEERQELESLSTGGDMEIDTMPEGIVSSTEEIEVILLVGSDSRFGVGAAARSDTLMLGVIDRTHKKIKLISILRDLYAAIPHYGNQKINNAFFFDSVNGNHDLSILRTTIANNLGIDTEKFVIIDFSAFETLVDALGGVTIEVTDEEADYMCHHRVYGLFPRYEAGGGTYTMTGAEALNYARMRNVSGQNDFNRTGRQREMLSSIMGQAKSMSYLDMAGIVKKMLPYITTNYSEGELLGLVFDAVSILGYDIEQFTIPVDGTWTYEDVEQGGIQISVISANFARNSSALQSFIFDDDMTYVKGNE